MSIAELVPYVILACCVLHNLCIEGCNDAIDDFIEEGRQHEERNNAEQNQEPANEHAAMINDVLGPAKRDFLAALIT